MILKLIKWTPGTILKKSWKIPRGRCHHKISKQNIKLTISPLLSWVWGQYGYQKKRNSSGKSIFLVWSAVFQSKLSKLQKTLRIGQKHWKTAIFQRFFEVCSILAEKQRPKPKNSGSLKIYASFDTLLDPRGAIVKQFLHFVLKFDNSGALYNFFSNFLKLMYFIRL